MMGLNSAIYLELIINLEMCIEFVLLKLYLIICNTLNVFMKNVNLQMYYFTY